MDRIREDVNSWNQAARDANQPDFVIGGFMQSAMRVAQENSRSAAARYERTTGHATRPVVDSMIDNYGISH
jgi:phage terminase large subunit-like protein